MRIGSFIVRSTSKSPSTETVTSSSDGFFQNDENIQSDAITQPSSNTSTKGSIFNIQRRFQLIRTNLGIMNNHEPTSSTDPPSPPMANWYKGDDYIYHRVNGLWKRTSISKFNNNG
jgi:hypothetical protein